MVKSVSAISHTRPVEILLVEDNPVDFRLIQEAFRDYRVEANLHVVTDGVQAMDFIYQRGEYKNEPRPDLILLDLGLPKKDGREVLEEVKDDDTLRAIPVIVLTTSELDKDVMGSYCHYANAFVTKPIEADEYIAMMRSIGDFWLMFVTFPQKG